MEWWTKTRRHATPAKRRRIFIGILFTKLDRVRRKSICPSPTCVSLEGVHNMVYSLQLGLRRYTKLLHARAAWGSIFPARGSPRNSLERRVVTASWRCGTDLRTMDDDSLGQSLCICTVHQMHSNAISKQVINFRTKRLVESFG